MNAIQSLIRTAEAAFSFAEGLRVERSLPLLYFGDYYAFRKSNLRVVTVGLNPGPPAFCKDRNTVYVERFQKALPYQDAWNLWFDREEDRWFKNLDHVLHGFCASFYRDTGFASVAIHTDLLSPVATEKPWSELKQLRKNRWRSTECHCGEN